MSDGSNQWNFYQRWIMLIMRKTTFFASKRFFDDVRCIDLIIKYRKTASFLKVYIACNENYKICFNHSNGSMHLKRRRRRKKLQFTCRALVRWIHEHIFHYSITIGMCFMWWQRLKRLKTFSINISFRVVETFLQCYAFFPSMWFQLQDYSMFKIFDKLW